MAAMRRLARTIQTYPVMANSKTLTPSYSPVQLHRRLYHRTFQSLCVHLYVLINMSELLVDMNFRRLFLSHLLNYYVWS